MKKVLAIIITIILVFTLTACGTAAVTTEGSKADKENTLAIANKLQENQPTPSDIDYSLERYNLIRRTYWVNGQREKANTLPCEVEKPLSYVVLLLEGVGVVASYVVDGKVSSLNSFLTPDSEYFEKDTAYRSLYSSTSRNVDDYSNKWLADVDGSYGENDNGIFFFTPDGNYIEWTGIYHYSDVPIEIDDPVLKVKVGATNG